MRHRLGLGSRSETVRIGLRVHVVAPAEDIGGSDAKVSRCVCVIIHALKACLRLGTVTHLAVDGT